MMQPVILEKQEILLVGFSFYGDPFRLHAEWSEENEIGLLWKRWSSYFQNHSGAIRHIHEPGIFYEVHIRGEETYSKGLFEVFVGVEVERFEHLPFDVSAKVLPATKYAVFTLQGRQIVSDWEYPLAHEWLPKAGVTVAYPYGFQRYDERFKGMERIEESALDIYVPIL
jgi:AraC family transcriptional regulator